MFHMLYSKMHCSCDTCEQVTGMAASKYKRSLKKKLNSELAMVVSSLRKENAYLKRTLAELTHQQSQHNKLVEVIMLTLLSLIIFTIFCINTSCQYLKDVLFCLHAEIPLS